MNRPRATTPPDGASRAASSTLQPVPRGPVSAATPTSNDQRQPERYAADGTALGGELQVNDHTAGAQKLSRITKTDRGTVVVVWNGETSPGSDNNGWSVQGRLLDLPIFRDGFESGDTSHWSASH